MQSRLASLPVLTTRQRCLFSSDIFFRIMCLKICALCCQPTLQLQSYSTLWMICHSYGKWNWSFCVAICMDGADVITGQLSGFTTQVKEVTSECETAHCVIHTEMLASKKSVMFCMMWLKLSTILKYMALNHICLHLCEEMDVEHTFLLLNTEVRWISKGVSLPSVFELWDLLQEFLLEIHHWQYTAVTQFSSLAQSCPTLCNPMDCSMPGFLVLHQLLELDQTNVHRFGDAIKPSHPLSSPSPPTFNLSQHQVLFQ